MSNLGLFPSVFVELTDICKDALNLRALRDRGIDAVLNCAVRDCSILSVVTLHVVALYCIWVIASISLSSNAGEAEIACFKPHRPDQVQWKEHRVGREALKVSTPRKGPYAKCIYGHGQ